MTAAVNSIKLISRGVSYGASIVDKCGDVMHRCGSPEEARGVDTNAAASGATIGKANKLCGMFLSQGTCSIILKW